MLAFAAKVETGWKLFKYFCSKLKPRHVASVLRVADEGCRGEMGEQRISRREHSGK